jgi:hypothetical protein
MAGILPVQATKGHLAMGRAFFLFILAQAFLAAQPSSVAQFTRQLKNIQHGMFVLLEDESAPMQEDFKKLLQEEDLADFKLTVRTLKGTSSDIALVSYLKNAFSWADGTRWAFVGSDERCLAHGAELPSIQELADQLAQAGIETPVRRLRSFLRRYPDHLDARLALLSTLRTIAVERARVALGLVSEDGSNTGQRGGRPSRSELKQSKAMKAARKPAPLPPENDLRIWVRWADEFDKLMESGLWLESDFAFDVRDELLDMHSPIVKAIFKKRIALVEDALRRWPGSERIWGIWLHMSLVLGDRLSHSFVSSLSPMPGTIHGTWPPYEAKLVLMQEAERKGDWGDVRTLLMESWAQAASAMAKAHERSAKGLRPGERPAVAMYESQWVQLLEPLIEAMLKMSDTAGAEAVLHHVIAYSGWDDVPSLAAAIAARCQMPQLAARWKGL